MNNITPEYIIERKQNKKQLLIWKFIAIVAAAVLIFSSLGKLGGADKSNLASSEYIGTVAIEGLIIEDPKRDSKLERIATDEKIKALIVYLNSPGGTVVGSEKIYNILRKISEKKPVVVVMGTLAASGGYLISLGGDYIISHNGTITGSIGVIMQTAEVTELAEKIGIKFNNFKSGEFKAAPNPTEKLTDSVRQAIMENIDDTYEYFTELVAERRQLDIEEVKKLADGRIYSGRQALKLKLVDLVGTDDSAVEWLRKEKKLDEKLRLREISLKHKPKLVEMILEDFSEAASVLFGSILQGNKSVL